MRHPSVESLVGWLAPNPRLLGRQREIAEKFHTLSIEMLNIIPTDDPELSAGLRKLLEAKDCMVRASIGGGSVPAKAPAPPVAPLPITPGDTITTAGGGGAGGGTPTQVSYGGGGGAMLGRPHAVGGFTGLLE